MVPYPQSTEHRAHPPHLPTSPPPLVPPTRIAWSSLARCVTEQLDRKTNHAFLPNNRLGQLPPCSCCAPSRCFPRAGISSLLSYLSLVSSGRFSSTYVLSFFPTFLSLAGAGQCFFLSAIQFRFNREYPPSVRNMIPSSKGVSSNESSRFGLTWCTCTVSVFPVFYPGWT